jgi:hypothetical protein
MGKGQSGSFAFAPFFSGPVSYIAHDIPGCRGHDIRLQNLFPGLFILRDNSERKATMARLQPAGAPSPRCT